MNSELKYLSVGDCTIGEGYPVYIVAEIGINHNGDVGIAKSLIDVAAKAGANAVKFQKRTPELCVPPTQMNIMRQTPWGEMSYLEYRKRIEFGDEEYYDLEKYAAQKNIELFVSPWDIPSLKFAIEHGHNLIKVASASLTHIELLREIRKSGLPVIASTGMSTLFQIDAALEILDRDSLVLCHTTSSYPCNPNELNLRMINTLKSRYGIPIGYSGHETGLSTSVAAVALGAVFLERHITLDRTLWGSDQAASVEPLGFAKLIRDVRNLEVALGDGVKKVYESERVPMERLRLN